VQEISTINQGIVLISNTILCRKPARINTQVKHIIIGGGFLVAGFSRGTRGVPEF
jgi:hypothetical protein